MAIYIPPSPSIVSQQANAFVNAVQATKAQNNKQYAIKRWLWERNKGRTDLLWLCNNVLGYRDVNAHVHGIIVNGLQKFAGCDEYVDPRTGKIVSSVPRIPLWELKGSRRSIILFPRGGLKTSMTMAHKIQWILNYPDVRILFNTSVEKRANEIMIEILSQFRFNNRFRFLYPEYCPPADEAGSWGSLDGFNVPNRKEYRRAPTVSIASVGKVVAGPHYEVVVHSDVVDENNINTPGLIKKSIDHYKFCIPLLEQSNIPPHRGWIDVEGTVYDFGDLYSWLLDNINSGDPDWAGWSVIKQDAEVDTARQISYWPDRVPWSELKRIEKEVGPSIYAANYRQNPVPEGGGLALRNQIDVKPFYKVLKPLVPRLRLHATVDLHGMEDNLGNDYTVLNVAGFDRFGRVYVLDIQRGHFSPHDVINMMFDLDDRWRKFGSPILDWKIEKDAHSRVLLPFLKREMQVRQRFLTTIAIPRASSSSKPQRIRGLQSWFAGGIISFSDSISCLTEVVTEILQFPKGKHDDILDTLSDHMQNRDGGVVMDVIPGPRQEPAATLYDVGKFMGFDPVTKQPLWTDEPPVGASGGYARAGI